MYMPKNRGDVETSRIKLVANVPIPVRNKNDFLVIGGEYNRYYFEVPDSLIANASTLNKLHIIDLNLAYVSTNLACADCNVRFVVNRCLSQER